MKRKIAPIIYNVTTTLGERYQAEWIRYIRMKAYIAMFEKQTSVSISFDTDVKQICRLFVYLYVMFSSVAMMGLGLAAMGSAALSWHFRYIEVSDVYLWGTGVILIVFGLFFIIGLDLWKE